VGALEDFDDFAIGAAIGFDAGDADHDAVAVHGLFGGFGRDEDIAYDAFDGVSGNEETVAIAVHVEAADGEFAAAGGGSVVAGAKLDQVAAGGETGERGFQLGAVVAFGADFADQLLEVGPGMRQAGDVGEKGRVGHVFIFIQRERTSERQYRRRSF
jgi:hypothetical protein